MDELKNSSFLTSSGADTKQFKPLQIEQEENG